MERYELSHAIVSGQSALAPGAIKPEGLSLAIGFFDGVHLGHAEVVKRAVSLAKRQGLKPAVLTFDPHPRTILGHDGYHTVLTPLDDKLSLLAELGMEVAYVVSFDMGFAEVSAERFVTELLLPLGVKTAVVGFDFKFGHRGRGNAELLRTAGGGTIDVQVVEPVFQGGAKVSSTRIREMLSAGRCDEAEKLLGRPYAITGVVVHGDARGRLLGFPTANMKPDVPYVLPLHGVYAVTIDGVDGAADTRKGVINVGLRPTFDAPGGVPKLETHLFDFDGDLYGQNLTVRFRSFLRPETKFASFDELKAQIGRDAESARAALASASL
ncbi:bifunctional riboflavin kinase/FAD synthetase [Cohnella nanjingensis]|uniref:Riboflavin biosynthesis protein n=1 Tax=Cohnella nanjingensis TaxID=1387779 RepID=A0A7X0VGH7_9BACL|nr:bifunctional riboflavin kinase/FAD synthetase [Cohnella nanjingensis]MBB6672866.1 bifunctional riboflavin kinase/FAD synthetase [Cohnella nanjingensis]